MEPEQAKNSLLAQKKEQDNTFGNVFYYKRNQAVFELKSSRKARAA